MTTNAELLGLLGIHLVLTGVPGVAAALCACRLGVRQVPILLATALAASGIAAMVAFWAYYADPLIGQTWSYFVLFGSIALVVWSSSGSGMPAASLRSLCTPLLLWALASAFVLFFGFLHGGTEEPLVAATTRFSSGPLPADNAIPFFYADWFYENGSSGTPPVFPGEWLSSDRPPLQVGYVLSQRMVPWDGAGLNYQVLGVVVQQLWIVGLWALLLAANLGRATRALAALAVLVSPLAILNGFFVWPKLLPAAMLLAAAALLITPLWVEVRQRLWAACLVGALLALAMLGHGASVFGVVPLAAVAAARGLPSWRWLGTGLLVGLVLTASWAAYQRFEDPPGNRLAKWMLAGVTEIEQRGTLEAIGDSYGAAGFSGAIENKARNFATMTGVESGADRVADAVDELGSGNAETAARHMREMLFFYLVPSLGLLLFGPLAMIVLRRNRHGRELEWRFALGCFALVAIGCAFWGLALFGNDQSRTIVHAGSYMLPILAAVGCVVGLRAVAPRVAYGVIGASALFTLLIYAPALEPIEGTGYSLLAALLASASLAGFAALAFGQRLPLPRIRQATDER